jgi:hypothetical protein
MKSTRHFGHFGSALERLDGMGYSINGLLANKPDPQFL